MGDPTAPSGVERRTDGSSTQGVGSAFELGLGLGLVFGLKVVGELIAEFKAEVSLMVVVPTEEKSK